MILVFTARKFENRVMTVMAAGQFMLSTMILGIKAFGVVLGQGPFELMRNQAGPNDAAFFQDPNYLSHILDGNGINPLLENYWMVIHPPVLFLGYSAAIVPFAYAIASLWKRDYHTWLKPAFPWTIFGVISLGVGILLGGAWAYESLTFGGFWAWDPVENASLIPWLIMIAGMHMLILNKKRNHSFGLSYILVVFSYILVVYASYLTRSGVLGETSVHAFGNNGLSTQMIAIMFITIGVSLVLYFKNFKNFPANAKDEFLSREFWMYLGSIILVLSSLQILISTSVPVINKIFGSEIAPPLDVVGFYNRWQLPFAVLILIITSVSLVLRYGKNDIPSFLKRFGITLVTANVLFVAQLLIFDISTLPNFLFLVTINLAIVSSVDYLIRNKFNLYNLSNTLSHLGIAMFLMGVLVAFSTSKVISTNTSRFDLGDAQTNKENQLLQRNQKKELNEYIVEYTTRRQEGNHLFYGMEFYKLDKDGNPVKDFTVEPSINVNKRMGNVYDPDTYHSFEKDVFTYITYADIEADMTNDRFKELIEKPISVGDTLRVDGYPVVLDSIRVEGNSVAQVDVNNVAIIATLHIIGKRESTGKFELAYRITNGEISKSYHIVEDIGIRFRFVNINAESQGMIIAADKQDMEFIVVKSTVFPYISIMWIGVFITVIGLSLSLYRNIKLSHKK
jgi:cytochrome c-type biogenesis protein CcmF